MVISM